MRRRPDGAASSATSVNASTCGRCDTAANIASCRWGSSVVTRAPQVCHNSATRSVASRAVSGSGVRMTLRPSNSDANAAAAPVCSVPAIGWPGTKRGNASANAARAAAITSCLVLPASVTTVAGPMAPAIVANSVGNCATGVATSTTSASAVSRAQSASSGTRGRSPNARAPHRDWPAYGRRPRPRRRRRHASARARTSRRSIRRRRPRALRCALGTVNAVRK